MNKVMHVLVSNKFSGAENVVITIIKNMNQKQWSCTYLCPHGPIEERLSKEGVSYIPLKNVTPWALKKAIKQVKPDLIHAHDFMASTLCGCVAKKIPVISHLHNNPPWLAGRNVYTFMYKLVSKRFINILGVSDAIYNEFIFKKAIKSKYMSVGNPLDIERISKDYFANEEKRYDVLFLGRLSKPKNPLLFIDIINAVRNEIPDIRANIVGTGELESLCKKKVAELGMEHNIHFGGFSEKPQKQLNESKILCMPSTWEGFGLAAVEALSFKLPVVASCVGGLSYIVNDDCGRLCSEPKEYVDEIVNLLKNDQYYLKKSYAAGERALELDNIQEYMQQLIQLYKRVLD